MNSSLLWLGLVLIPLAAIPLLGGGTRKRVVPWLWLTSLPGLLLAFWPVDSLELQLLWPAARWGSGDSLTRGWLGFSALIWTLGGLYAAGTQGSFRFWLFWLTALSGNLLLCIAQDGLSFYVGFSVMSLAAYGLIAHRDEAWRRRAGRIYLQMALFGEMLVFAGLVLQVQSAQDMVSFGQWQKPSVDFPTMLLIFVGFAIKAGLWPLHSWMPLAYPAPPAAAAAVLAGAMTEAGILGIWRFLPAEHGVVHDWSEVFFGLGLVSAFFGVLMGLTSHRARATLAYSSISQMGYLLVIMALAWHSARHLGAVTVLLLLFAAHHGIAKAALFIGAGVANRIRLPSWSWLLLAVPALAISGLPLTSGGAVKGELEHLLADSTFSSLSPLFKLAALGTTLLLIRALWLIRNANRELPARSASLTFPMWVVWVSFGLLPLVLPWAWPLFRDTMGRTLSWSTTWQLLWPMGLALVLAAAALRLNWRAPRRWPIRRNPALRASIYLKRWMQNPPVPKLKPHPDWVSWRKRERRWNHFLSQRGTVASTAWLLCGLLLVGVIWSTAW